MTIKQALNKLPFPYNEMAIDEYEKQKWQTGVTAVSNCSDALMWGFVWDFSKMGVCFWLGVEENCKYKKL